MGRGTVPLESGVRLSGQAVENLYSRSGYAAEMIGSDIEHIVRTYLLRPVFKAENRFERFVIRIGRMITPRIVHRSDHAEKPAAVGLAPVDVLRIVKPELIEAAINGVDFSAEI